MREIEKALDIEQIAKLPNHELFDNESPDLDYMLRILESKILDVPNRVKKANSKVDWTSSTFQEISVDLESVSSDLYEFVALLRENPELLEASK